MEKKKKEEDAVWIEYVYFVKSLCYRSNLEDISVSLLC